MNMDLDFSAMVAKLEKCKTGVAVDGKRKALRAGGKVIERAMSQNAPLLSKRTTNSTALSPGALRNGMRTSIADRDGELTARIGPKKNVDHVALWVEYGHRMVKGGYSKELANGKSRGPGVLTKVKATKTEFVPAYPFLRPAYESSVAEAVEAMELSLAETIEEQVR